MKSLSSFRSQELTEGTKYSSDFMITPDGRKVHPNRIVFGGYDKDNKELSQTQINKKFYRTLMGQQKSSTQKRIDALNPDNVKKEEYIEEAVSQEPPMVLVLKRKSIRMFPDGTKAAMYRNDMTGKEFLIGFGTNTVFATEETVEEELTCIDYLRNMESKKDIVEIHHADGSSTEVDYITSKAILEVFDNLSEDNQNKMQNMISEAKWSFTKVADFALSRIK